MFIDHYFKDTKWQLILLICFISLSYKHSKKLRGSRDRMVIGFIITCAISAYHHSSCEFEFRSWQGVLVITLCDKVCQWLVTGQWFFPFSFTNKSDRHNITEILLKVMTVNTINQPSKKILVFITDPTLKKSWIRLMFTIVTTCSTFIMTKLMWPMKRLI